MFTRKAKPSTDARLRSLLQKAVRRGYLRVVERTAQALDRRGDGGWLRGRTVVISFEECWPLANYQEIPRTLNGKIEILLKTATAEKYKDAASLGAMGYAFSVGDASVLGDKDYDREIRLVAEAIRRPKPFFEWCLANCHSTAQATIVGSAQRFLGTAGWAWDKACLLAAAYLASSRSIPQALRNEVAVGAFPYWVALDKHTPQGKTALRTTAKRLKLPYRQLIWCSFYFESAVVNLLSDSPWWAREKSWRLKKAGLAMDEAKAIWAKARTHVAEELQHEAEALRHVIEQEIQQQGESPQTELNLGNAKPYAT